MDETTASRRQWIESVVREHERPLSIYASRLMGSVDRGRDVVQDAFLKLWQADRQAVEGHVTKWLYTVCRNRALDERRKERRMTRLDDGMLAARPHPERAAPPGAGEADVASLVARLPERQQEAVRLKFQGGLSYREIAEVMDTTVNNVGVLLHMGIKSIRRTLADGAAASGGGEARIGATR